MKILEIFEGVGRITQQNQTADVGPNQVSIEAAKFGFKVDEDGRPAKKARGSNVHKLSNLSLSESVLVKLERDKRNNIYVLHMVDNQDKHRVELRGEKGYETGNYNKHDRLHQVLDGLGKAVDLGALFAGETVSINPHHPDGEQALNITKAVMSGKDNNKKINEQEKPRVPWIIRQLQKGINRRQIAEEFGKMLARSIRHRGKSQEQIDRMAYAAVQYYADRIDKYASDWKPTYTPRDELVPSGYFYDPVEGMLKPLDEYFIEKAPPGREKQVKKLKKKFDDPSTAYAIAWAQHNKHGKP